MVPHITSILFAGVGGQGVVLSSEVVARAAMIAGFDVKKTEVHGVAQRGGTVMSHVRYGTKVYSPLSPVGGVDLMVALEKLEGLRFSHYLKTGGRVILNEEGIVPTRYIGEKLPYPGDIAGILNREGYATFSLDAREIARQAGSRRAFNVVMIGALSHLLGMTEDVLKRAIMDSLPPNLHALNLKAFDLGRIALDHRR